MTPPDPASHLLPQQQAEEIYRSAISPSLFDRAQPDPDPVVIVLTAPPGAGKSTLARELAATFPEHRPPVLLDVDSFRPYYPGYLAMHREYGWAADDLVQEDARRWLEMGLEEAVARGRSVILEHGLRSREVFDDLVNRVTSLASASGSRPYRIESAILATSAAESRLGMLERYQVGHERTGFGRYVADDVHDARHRHLAAVADWLDADPRVTAVAVYRRGETDPIHRNERRPDGSWRSPERSSHVLQAERERPWSLDDSRAFLRVHQSLESRMAPEWATSLRRARMDADRLLHPAAGVPSHDRPAVTFGRYQIVSIAHLDTVRTILLDWPTVEIGVLDLDARPTREPDIPAHLAEFYRGCAANTSPTRNPMTAEERAEFWRATIARAGLEDRVTVRTIPRPELYPDTFNTQYPPDQFDLVFPTASGEGFDRIRNASFEEILGRQVRAVDPPLEYHTSDIRSLFRNGNDAWRNGFAPGGLEAFLAVDGPRRLLGAPQPPRPALDTEKPRVAKRGFRPLPRVEPGEGAPSIPLSTPPRPPRHNRGRG